MTTDTHIDQLTLHGYREVEEMGGRCGRGCDRRDIEAVWECAGCEGRGKGLTG